MKRMIIIIIDLLYLLCFLFLHVATWRDETWRRDGTGCGGAGRGLEAGVFPLWSSRVCTIQYHLYSWSCDSVPSSHNLSNYIYVHKTYTKSAISLDQLQNSWNFPCHKFLFASHNISCRVCMCVFTEFLQWCPGSQASSQGRPNIWSQTNQFGEFIFSAAINSWVSRVGVRHTHRRRSCVRRRRCVCSPLRLSRLCRGIVGNVGTCACTLHIYTDRAGFCVFW